MDYPVEFRSPSQARKRLRKPENWKRAVAKKRRNTGLPYKSRTTGKDVDGRVIGPPCKCKRKCFELVGQENIQAIFTNYWETGCWFKQTAYIQKQVTDRPIQRTCTDNAKKKSCSRLYTVTAGGVDYVVCREAFASIHGFNPSRVKRAMKNQTATGVPIGDGRGMHTNHPRVPEHKQNLVKEHINSFPTVTNHYSRKTCPDVRYLEEHVKTKKHMWELYKLWLSEVKNSNEEPCSESYYKNVLFEFFPEIKLSKPRSDTCKICDIYQIQLKNGSLSEEARRKLELEYLHHHKKAAEGYKLTKKLTG